MENWITPAVVVGIVSAIGTYLTTKKTTETELKKTQESARFDLEKFYSEKLSGMMLKIEEENERLKNAMTELEKKVKKLEENLNAKDILIEQLKKDNARLEEECAQYRGYIKQKDARIKELEEQ